MTPVARMTSEAQALKWKEFKETVLLPAIIEMSIVNTPNARTWHGSMDYNLAPTRVIHIHNTRPCGWDYIPFAAHTRPLFQNTTVHHHHHQRADRNDLRQQDENHNDNRRTNSALVIATVAACILGAVYTCYQMAHSIGQYLSSSRSITEMTKAHDSIKGLEGLDDAQRKKINTVVTFRNDYLKTANQRSFSEIAQDVAIIGGLAMIGCAAIAGFPAALITIGTIAVIGALVLKVTNTYRFPNLDSSEKRHQAQYIILNAKELYKSELTLPKPPSDPYPGNGPLYPNLSQFSQELGAFYHIQPNSIVFLPSQNANGNDQYVFPAPSAPEMED